MKFFNFESGLQEEIQFYEYDPNCDIYLVKYHENSKIGTMTVLRKNGPPTGNYFEVIDFLGEEKDVLRPSVGTKPTGLRGCIPALIKEDGPCSCLRYGRLGCFDKTSLEPVSDEVLNKIHTNWEHIFSQHWKKPSFEELKEKYNG